MLVRPESNSLLLAWQPDAQPTAPPECGKSTVACVQHIFHNALKTNNRLTAEFYIFCFLHVMNWSETQHKSAYPGNQSFFLCHPKPNDSNLWQLGTTRAQPSWWRIGWCVSWHVCRTDWICYFTQKRAIMLSLRMVLLVHHLLIVFDCNLTGTFSRLKCHPQCSWKVGNMT